MEMAGKTTPILLVTANVGSIFEDPSHMLKIWTEEFLSTVARLDPKFIALHCQEVGGKNYERSMKHVEDFVRLFMSSEELRLFDKVRVFLDEDYSSAENFTALGNFYFIHESLSEVLIWDFSAMTFVSAKGKEVHSGNIEAVTTKEKSKFPQDFFPECKWSRKGFLRTRWNLNGTVLDLINIHLFHDASNFIAMESFPSVYCKNRRRALEHTLERFHNDCYETVPFFVFGDFNFRTDTQGVINKLTDGLVPVRVQSNKSNDHTKLQYKDDASQVVLSLGKKEFSHVDHQSVFLDKSGTWLKEFDRELEAFAGRLFEFAIAFPPSYPFEEDEKGGNDYMKTRCPAWCDRVILSNTAKNLVNNVSDAASVEYGLMGPNTRMGDHKPVYLKMDLINDAGTVSCCTSCDTSSSDKCVMCFGNVAVCEPASWSCSSLSLKQGGSASSSALTLKLDTSAAALAADCFLAPPHASLLHEPYTPESMETPSSSPVPVRIQRDFGEIGVVEWKCGADDDEEEEYNACGTINVEKLSDSNTAERVCSSVRECLKSDNKQYSSMKENIKEKEITPASDVELSARTSNNNPLTDSIIDNFSQFKSVGHDVPQVFVCYPDSQEESSHYITSSEKNHNDPGSLQSETNSLIALKLGKIQEIDIKSFEGVQIENENINKSSAFIYGDELLQEASEKLSFISEQSLKCLLDRKEKAIQKKIVTFSRKTLSLESVLLPKLPISDCSSSVKCMKNEYFEKNLKTPLCLSETCVKTSHKEEKGNFSMIISSELNECEKESYDGCDQNQCTNVHETCVHEVGPNITGDKNALVASISTNDINRTCENRSSHSGHVTSNELWSSDSNVIVSSYPSESVINEVNPNKNILLDEKLSFPVNSQDCINIISTEISSHLKRTEDQKPEHVKNETLKKSSKKACSRCCTIM